MLNKIRRIGLAILLIVLMIVTCIYIRNENKKNATTTSDGHIVVIINDINNNMVSKKRIGYKKGDKLYSLLENNYKIEATTSVYGHYILSISDANFSIETNGDTNGWIWIELCYLKEGKEYSDDIDINKYDVSDSTIGIDGIEIKDEMIIVLNERDNNHNTSILNTNIESKPSKSNNISRIVLYIIIAVIIVLFVVYLIICKANSKLTVKKLCILSAMCVVLFVQEEVLSVLPNIQLTFLLIALYTAVFGLKYSFMIIFVHVMLDNMVMGSLNPIVMIPMMLGYFIYAILIYLVKNKKLVYIVLMGVLGSLIYCYMFLVANSLFLDIDIRLYFIADVPFEILLVLSTILTITYLYRPLEKILIREWNGKIEE